MQLDRQSLEDVSKLQPSKIEIRSIVQQGFPARKCQQPCHCTKAASDTMLIAEKCLLMLGEDKHTDLAAAFADLQKKRVDLSGMHYGPLRFLLGYAAG